MDDGKLSVALAAAMEVANWQWCDAPLWAAELWQDTVAQAEDVIVKVPHKMFTYLRVGALKNTENEQVTKLL